MRPEKAEEVQAWLARAAADIRAGRADLAVSPPLTGDVLFHCQQAVEKALKAFLTAHDRPFPKTHDLDELLSRCGEVDPALAQSADAARDLTPFAWRFRYPGEQDEPPEAEAQAALALAERVCREVAQRISVA